MWGNISDHVGEAGGIWCPDVLYGFVCGAIITVAGINTWETELYCYVCGTCELYFHSVTFQKYFYLAF